MLRFTLRETARLVFGILGAAALAACLASLDNAHAWHGAAAFFESVTRHLAAFLRLDFGTSAVSGGPAIAELAERLPSTLVILAMGAVLALLVGGPLGILFGGGPGRRAAAPLIQLVAATPVFCAALALSFVAQRFLHWPIATNATD